MMERGEFSFFSNPKERRVLLKMSTQDMARLMDMNPGMSGRFIHEWLRLRSERIVYEALILCEELPQTSSIIIHDILVAAANMSAIFEIEKQEVHNYIATAYRVIYLAVNHLLFKVDPDSEGWMEMEREISKLIREVDGYRDINAIISNAKWN